MNKEKIIKGASEILGISADDKFLSDCLKMIIAENSMYELSDEAWTWGLAEAYTFSAGMFEKWKECVVKFNKLKYGVGK